MFCCGEKDCVDCSRKVKKSLSRQKKNIIFLKYWNAGEISKTYSGDIYNKQVRCVLRDKTCVNILYRRLFFETRLFEVTSNKSCICDVEECELFVQIISTDNYPLNVKLFKLFSPTGKLETRVPHPCDTHRGIFLTFDFVHILKTVRNNWLNQQTDWKLFSYPDFDCIFIDRSTNPLKVCHASFRDIRILFNSERDSLAKLAPLLKVLLSIHPRTSKR